MLTLLPVLFLALTALVVFLLRGLERGTGFSWLTGVILSLAAWVGVLWIHWQNIPRADFASWRPFDLQNADRITYIWDHVSWPLGFALVSLLVCLLLTAPARLQHKSGPTTWSANLAITAIGLLAVLAASPMAAVLAWTLLDIVELILIIRMTEGETISRQAVVAFCAKAGGTLLMLWAMVQSYTSGGTLEYPNVQASTWVFILIAVGLRLGVLPLNVPYSGSLPMQRGMTTSLRMAAQASSLAVLARLPGGLVSGFWLQALLVIASLATFYGAAMYATARDEPDGRMYWSLALAGFAVTAALHGDQSGVLTWGIVLIVSGGILSFYSARSRGLIFLPVLGLIGLVGLPFTPAAAGIAGFASPPFHVADLLWIVSLALLSAGYLRLSLMAGDTLNDVERWVLGVYPPGIILLAVSGWMIVILNRPGGLIPGVWWASAASFLLAGLLVWVSMVKRPDLQGESAGLIRTFRSAISPVLNLSWLYRIFYLFLVALQQLLGLITRVLEGEGGVLWAMLLVVLLLTVLAGGGLLQ